MTTEKVGPPNLLLGGLMKYGTIIGGAYIFFSSLKIFLDQDKPSNVLKKALKILNNDSVATECLGKGIQPEIFDKNSIFQYPENGVLKINMTVRVVGSKDRGTYHVQAKQNEKKKRFRFNWVYDSLKVDLDDGTVIIIEIK